MAEVALLPDDPSEQYRMLAILVLAGVGALYWIYVHGPRSAELDQKENRLARVQAANRAAQDRSAALDELREELATYERQLDALRELVPGRSEVARLYETIARESQSRNLELVAVTPTAPERDSGSYYLRQNWEMTVEGSYHQVGRFLAEVASLDRIVRPSVQSIEQAGGGSEQGAGSGPTPVSVELELETYVLPPDSLRAGGAGGDDAASGGEGADG